MHRASSADCVIGVDLGTQGVRGVAVTSNGALIARASVPLQPEALPTDPGGAFEQDAEEWWHTTSIMLSRIGEQLAEAGAAPNAVKALCIAGTSGTFVPLNSSHHPLRPALMYSDSRALAEALRCNSILSDLPHSAEGLTEKRNSSKVRKNAEGPNNVRGSGVSNGKTGSFGNSSRSVPRSRKSRVVRQKSRREPSKREYRDSHGSDDLEWARLQ